MPGFRPVPDHLGGEPPGAAVHRLRGAFRLRRAATASAFSGYVLGVLPVLLVLGGLSDRIGRKPPIVVALLLSMVATLVMALWPRLEALGVARLLLGVGTAWHRPPGRPT